MINFYIKKGYDIEKLVNLSFYEKIFFIEAMKLEFEEDKKKWGG